MIKKANIIIIVIILLILTSILVYTQIVNKKYYDYEYKNEIKIGLSTYKANDTFVGDIVAQMAQVAKEFEQEEGVKVTLDVCSAKESQRTQNEQIKRYIALDYDVICVNLVDRTDATTIINAAMDADIPLVFFNREPVAADIFRGENIYYVGLDTFESAVLQADIISESYFEKPEEIDKNGDGILQYAMLEGELGHQDAIIRTEIVIQTLIDEGIPLEKIVSGVANWERSQSKAIVNQWLQEKPLEIEIFICNNDEMALGVLDALEENNVTDVAVIGIDAIEAGIQAINEGKMLGTVDCNAKSHGNAIFDVASSLAIGSRVSQDIEFESERYIRIKLKKIMPN